KTMSGHLSEVNKSVSAVAQKLAARVDEQLGEVNKNVTRLDTRMTEQERRVDGLARNVDHVAQEAQVKGANSKGGQRQPQTTTKSTPRSSMTTPTEPASQPESVAAMRQEPVSAARQEPEVNNNAVERTAVPLAAEETPEPVAVAAVRQPERTDRAEYERVLAYFKEGNLDGSRDGFSAFLADYPNSDLAPNARYWLV